MFLLLYLLYFLIYNSSCPKYFQSYKKKTSNEIRDFIFEKYYKRIKFLRERSYYSMKVLKKKKYLLFLTNKLIEKISDLRDAKEHYESFIRNKN